MIYPIDPTFLPVHPPKIGILYPYAPELPPPLLSMQVPLEHVSRALHPPHTPLP